MKPLSPTPFLVASMIALAVAVVCLALADLALGAALFLHIAGHHG